MDTTEVRVCIDRLMGYWPVPEPKQPELLALTETFARYDRRDFDRAFRLLSVQGRTLRPPPGELMPLMRDSHHLLAEDDGHHRALPAGDSDGAAVLELMRAGTAAYREMQAITARRRKDGAEPMSDEQLHALTYELLEHFLGRPWPTERGPDDYDVWAEPTYRCLTCRDTGWKTLSEVGRTTVKPCPNCNPDQHTRWATRHWAPDWAGRVKD
jgi:hypothetical protein